MREEVRGERERYIYVRYQVKEKGEKEVGDVDERLWEREVKEREGDR